MGRLQSLKSTWTFLHSLAVTLRYSIEFLYKIYGGAWLTREQVNTGLRNWARRVLHLADVQYTITGVERCKYIPGRCYIIMSNHASFYDIPLILATLPGSIRMLAKRELFKVPIWGKAMKLADFLPITRGASKQALKDLHHAKAKMEDGIVLWIAPEGTRTRTGHMLPLKRGGFALALQTRAIILPVGITGARKVLPPDTWGVNLHQQVHIAVGDPIDTQNYMDQVPELMKKVSHVLHQLSGEISVPGSQHLNQG